MTVWTQDVVCERIGRAGLITLNRPRALNALSLPMIRQITQALQDWQDDPQVLWVGIRGTHKEGYFGSFCAGGDIRFFHQAALSGDPSLDDFFTEEYHLNHLIHTYRKPYLAFMDGVVMGGGMGLSQGASWRIVTERTQMAMPETQIGLFPDVAGGYFLSRCRGALGEYLALTGHVLKGAQAVTSGLADVVCPSESLTSLWALLTQDDFESTAQLEAAVRDFCHSKAQPDGLMQPAPLPWQDAWVDEVFSLDDVSTMVKQLHALSSSSVDEAQCEWAKRTVAVLAQKSPLMMCVTLMQIRRAREMSLADELRMERDMMRHCFDTQHLQRRGLTSETVEGIRALVIDKDQSPQWSPPQLADVTPEMVQGFFTSPWPASIHPLMHLG